MRGKRRERHPLRHLKLQMTVVIDSVRIQAEHQRGNPCRALPEPSRPCEDVRGEPGKNDAGLKQDRIGDGGMDAGPEQRRRGQRRQNHGIRVRQRGLGGIEDVGVEQVARVDQDLMRHPRLAPHREQRIAKVGHAVEIGMLLVKDHDDRRRQPQQHDQDFAAVGQRRARELPDVLSQSKRRGKLPPRQGPQGPFRPITRIRTSRSPRAQKSGRHALCAERGGRPPRGGFRRRCRKLRPRLQRINTSVSAAFRSIE